MMLPPTVKSETRREESPLQSKVSKLPLGTVPAYSGKLYAFDIDGVLIDSHTPSLSPEMRHEIVSRLEAGDAVILNTGRPMVWVVDNVLSSLVDSVSCARTLARCTAAAEKGVVQLSFSDSTIHVNADEQYGVPAHIRERLISYAAHFEFCSGAAWQKHFGSTDAHKFLVFDDAKLAMATLYIRDAGADPVDQKTRLELANKFKPIIAPEIVDYLHLVLREAGLEDQFRIDATTIAVDIEHIKSGKELGMRRSLRTLGLTPASTNSCMLFGDSSSDVEMAAEAARSGFRNLQYFHVGLALPGAPVVSDMAFTHTGGRFAADTLAALQKHS